MMKLAMSPAAAGLIRDLLARAAVAREAVLLTDYRSTEWHSLTFAGERHEVGLRIPGPAAAAIVERLLSGLADAEFAIAGHIVADIAVRGRPVTHDDGAITVDPEALTIAE